MLNQQLFQTAPVDKVVRVGVIGTGHYATAVITQAQAIPRLAVGAVCDVAVAAAERAYQRAGLSPADYVICHSRGEGARALAQGKRVIVDDPALLLELPLDLVVESTGVPEAGARHALAALHHGKHVAMVSKEVDVSVGPILDYRARRAGLVYSPVDGDQHGLLIGLVAWARDLGLEVLCAGKGVGDELIFDEGAGVIRRQEAVIPLSPGEQALFKPGDPAQTGQHVVERRAVLGRSGAIGGYDVVEMTIAANATGLVPDIERLHGPVVRLPEIPQVLCPVDEGGILTRRGVIECITCVRGPYEAGLGGGVFIVVACDNDYSRHILTTKGLIPNQRGTAALIYRPYHLCGVETPQTLLSMGLLGLSTGSPDYRPRFDVIVRAAEALPAGSRVGTDHSPTLQAGMRLAQPLAADNPIPLHLAADNRLNRAVTPGTLLTTGLVEPPSDSVLWQLRAEQDRRFLDQE